MKPLHQGTHILLISKGVRELKVRQIDHNIIFGWWFLPIMAISSNVQIIVKIDLYDKHPLIHDVH